MGDSLTYAWDVNGDGAPDASGVRPTLTARQMADLGLGVGEFSVRLTVSDAAGLTATDTAALTLLYGEFAPVAVAAATPLTVPAGCGGAGGAVTFSAAGSYEEGVHKIVLYQWIYNVPDPSRADAAFNAGGVDFQTTDGAFQPSHVYQWPAIYNAALRVIDDSNPQKTAIAVIRGITVDGPPNEAPVADAGGPYAVVVGEGLVLDGSGTSDPNMVCRDSLHYAWDINGDGITDVVGVAPTLTAAQLAAIGAGAGEHTVTLTVTDSGGLASRDTATLTIAAPDTTPPIFAAVSDFTVEATGPQTALTPTLPTAEDAVDGDVPVVCDAPGAFPLGQTQVHCSAEDRAGNQATTSFTITIVDTTPPHPAGLPADQAVAATGPAGASVSYAQPTAVDLVDGAVEVVCRPVSGSLFAVGETTVECRAKDASGNEATRSFRVVVTPYPDVVRPVLAVPDALSVNATAPWGTVVTYIATARDDRDGTGRRPSPARRRTRPGTRARLPSPSPYAARSPS